MLLGNSVAHGTRSVYTNRGCRCDACCQAQSAYMARYNAENVERKRQHNAEYHECHQSEIGAKRSAPKKRYYRLNRDSIRASQAQYYQENRGCFDQRNSRRRARERDAFIEDIDRGVVYEIHGGMCGICKQFIQGDFHVDHVIPLSKGGLHGYVNVQPAHPKCNLEKGTQQYAAQ